MSIQLALCDQPLREISNPGASGSLFYLSADDAFIIKTVQKKEARFLQKLLPGYYLVSEEKRREREGGRGEGEGGRETGGEREKERERGHPAMCMWCNHITEVFI